MVTGAGVHRSGKFAVDPEIKSIVKQMGAFSALSLEFGLSGAAGFVVGFYVDRWIGTTPWLTVIFLFAGIAAGIHNLVRMAKLFQKTGWL
ncbi:MAG TPA: AtpZ/AtpI family protein [bacterium]|nr:AtpZ/AtpI family protein [bacterium]